MEEKLRSLHKNRTWKLVQRPPKQKLVGSKWVFKFKEGILGVEKPRFKARLVARILSKRRNRLQCGIFTGCEIKFHQNSRHW